MVGEIRDDEGGAEQRHCGGIPPTALSLLQLQQGVDANGFPECPQLEGGAFPNIRPPSQGQLSAKAQSLASVEHSS